MLWWDWHGVVLHVIGTSTFQKTFGGPSSDLNPQPLANVIAYAIVGMASLKKKSSYHDLIVIQAHNH